jgi:hypothetical protein
MNDATSRRTPTKKKYVRFKFATSSSLVVPLLRQAILSLPFPFYAYAITPTIAQFCSPILVDSSD